MCSLIVAEPFACGVLCKAGGLACGRRGGEVVGSWAMSWSNQLEARRWYRRTETCASMRVYEDKVKWMTVHICSTVHLLWCEDGEG